LKQSENGTKRAARKAFKKPFLLVTGGFIDNTVLT